MALKIISFLPSATEMVCELGLEKELVGISHECDYPAYIQGKPIVVRNALHLGNLSLAEIDRQVSERLRTGASLYQVDEALVRKLEPDLILTQELCQVCAPSGNEVTQLLKSLSKSPHVLYLTPRSLAAVYENVIEIGRATGHEREAEKWLSNAQSRIEKIVAKTKPLTEHPRVFCMEWIDPVYCSGHWVPEMVEIAGGIDRLGRRGSDSVRISWDEVIEWDPEILIVTPCGFHLDKAEEQARRLASRPGWNKLSAVQNRKVYAADASSYFARPGPRLIEGAHLLAHLIHPELFDWDGPKDAYKQIL